uniref:Homocysteine S-Methyltransferase Family Protein n=1 Tax=Florenciella sp. virus SA2 TaxID=3240092 RepID=A0AB39JB35_9VIRU
MEQFRNKNNTKICGSLPPYFPSYHYEDIDDNFCNFYDELVNIFKGKVDYYIIETSVDFKHVKKICEIIKKYDQKTDIIVSLYINESNEKNIDKYFDLNIYGIFFNCCSFPDLVSFYDNHLKDKNFENKKFGFLCNKINEKKYAEESDVSNLQSFKVNKNITKNNLHSFLNKLSFKEVFIGGCCGYGVQEMKELIKILK